MDARSVESPVQASVASAVPFQKSEKVFAKLAVGALPCLDPSLERPRAACNGGPKGRLSDLWEYPMLFATRDLVSNNYGDACGSPYVSGFVERLDNQSMRARESSCIPAVGVGCPLRA